MMSSEAKEREKIVRLYRDQGLPLALLRRRLHRGSAMLRQVLAAEGITADARRRQNYYPEGEGA